MIFVMSLCTDCFVHVLVDQGVNLTNNLGITIKLWFFILLLSKLWRNDQCIFVNVITVLFPCHVPKISSDIVIRKGFKIESIFHQFSIVIEKGISEIVQRCHFEIWPTKLAALPSWWISSRTSSITSFSDFFYHSTMLLPLRRTCKHLLLYE